MLFFAMSDLTRATDHLVRLAPTIVLDDAETCEDTLMHNEHNASIIMDDTISREMPWTPKSLGRAKTAIIYKVI